MLWQLTFLKTPDAPRIDGFEVGYFSDLAQVGAVKADYAALPGFNRTPDGDECDLIESPVFPDKAAASACLQTLSARYQRAHMTLERIDVNRRWWADGFTPE